MLCKFAVTNYRGFEHKIEWDLTKARDYKFNSFAIKNSSIKNGIIYGPNGSGKSNFGLAIFDIVNHLIISPKNGQKIPKITNLQYNKGRANYGTKKKSIYG